MIRRLPALIIVALLAGCATLNESECRTADWYGIGLRDGHEGQLFERLDAHREACAKYGLAPDAAQYRDGREEGLRDYCRLDNAVRTGLRGQRYQGVCPGAAGADFSTINEAAYRVHVARQDIERVDDRIDDIERRLLDGKLSQRDRERLRVELRDLDRDLFMLRMELHQRESRLDRLLQTYAPR